MCHVTGSFCNICYFKTLVWIWKRGIFVLDIYCKINTRKNQLIGTKPVTILLKIYEIGPISGGSPRLNRCPVCIMLIQTPLDLETGWTRDVWLNIIFLKLQDKETAFLAYFLCNFLVYLLFWNIFLPLFLNIGLFSKSFKKKCIFLIALENFAPSSWFTDLSDKPEPTEEVPEPNEN